MGGYNKKKNKNNHVQNKISPVRGKTNIQKMAEARSFAKHNKLVFKK